MESAWDDVVRDTKTIIETRAGYPDSTLADLYDPLTMPAPLTKAHIALDQAVDAAYGRTSFKSEAERVAFLFGLYEKKAAPLNVRSTEKKTNRRTEAT